MLFVLFVEKCNVWYMVTKTKADPSSSPCFLFPHLFAALLECHLIMVLINPLLVLLGIHQSTLECLFLANLGLCAHWLLLDRLLWLFTIIFRWRFEIEELLVNLDVRLYPSSFSPAMSWLLDIYTWVMLILHGDLFTKLGKFQLFRDLLLHRHRR